MSLNLRHIKRRPEKPTKDNILSSVILNITDKVAVQKKLFKLGCKWNGAHTDILPDDFTHILIASNGRMSYYDENDSVNTTFRHYFRNDKRLETYKVINAKYL